MQQTAGSDASHSSGHRNPEAFPILTADQIRLIAAVGERRRFEDGDDVWMIGHEMTSFFVVVGGAVEVFQVTGTGEEHQVVVHQPGEFTGDIDLLRRVGIEQGYEVENMNTFALGEERVSSTRIREALARGDLEHACENLGRPYRICGRVAHGHARGRTIGFPTANINLHRKVSPLKGVYAVEVLGLGGGALPGVANIGNRPTVEGDDRYLLEVHLFDFSEQIYGEHVQVEFRKKLRDEQKFDSFDALRQQIERDAATAREFFGMPALESRVS